MIFKGVKTKYLEKAKNGNPRNSEASVIRLKSGALFLVYQHFYDSENGSNDFARNSLNSMYSFDLGETWENESVLVSTPENCINVYSPNLFFYKNGDIGLIYMQKSNEGNSIFVLRSQNDGGSFFEYSCVTKKQKNSISNDCIRRLGSGRFLLPATCMSGVWPSDTSKVTPFYSDDDGKTWISSENSVSLPMRGAMEPFVAEIADGSLLMVMRNQLGSVFKAISLDNGKTWSEAQNTVLTAPESAPYLINVPNSKAIIIGWNNSEYNPNWASHFGKRTPLTLAVTYDGGNTFKDVFDIENDSGRAFTNIGGTWIKDDRLLLTYWTSPYQPSGSFCGPIDLKQAIVDIDRQALEG